MELIRAIILMIACLIPIAGLVSAGYLLAQDQTPLAIILIAFSLIVSYLTSEVKL